MSVQIITQLPADRWLEYRILRLEALQTDPSAYIDTFEKAVTQPDSYWQQRMAVTDIAHPIFAEDTGKLVGSMCLLIPDAKIVGVYVTPSYRHQGVAQHMLTAISDIASKRDLQYVNLEVFHFNQPAIQLYLKNGFVETGRNEALISMRKKL